MGDVLHMPNALVEAQSRAFSEFSKALLRAQETGSIRDMRAAVRAYDDFLLVLIPDAAERSGVAS